MANKKSLRNMAENEVVFRRYNEKVTSEAAKLQELAEETNQTDFSIDPNIALQFYCECSDENCKQRIEITISTYKQIHTRRDNFVVIPGHDVPSIEEVVKKQDKYSIVKKIEVPDTTATTLNATDVNNV